MVDEEADDSRRMSPRCIAESTEVIGRKVGVTGLPDTRKEPERRCESVTAGLGRAARRSGSCRIYVYTCGPCRTHNGM